MATLILDHDIEKRVRESRHASGLDRYDEVWEGVYMMAPLANNEHQLLVTRLATICQNALGRPEAGTVYAGVNVSDREDDWTKNYRCPDVAVFLKGTTALDRGTHGSAGRISPLRLSARTTGRATNFRFMPKSVRAN